MAQKKKTTNKKVNKTQTKKEVLNTNTSFKEDLKKIIKCGLIVLCIFICMYGLTIFILNKSKYDYIDNMSDEKTTIQYSEIIAGTIFSKKNKDYLVLFYDSKNDDDKVYADLLSDYRAKDEHETIYFVDLSNSLNKSVISSESNKDAKNANELKISGPTLIKFVDNKIDEYLEGEESISDYLNK